MTAPAGPNPQAVGRIAAEHLGPILYALETCALTMERAGRGEEVRYYRALAELLAEAGSRVPPTDTSPPSSD